MSEPQGQLEQMWATAAPLVKPVLYKLPSLLMLLGMALVGYMLAKAARRVTPKLMDKLGVEALAERFGVSRALYAVGYQRGFGRFCGQVIYYVILLLSAQLILDQLQLQALSGLLAGLTAKLPDLLISGLIFLGALQLGQLVSGRLSASAQDPSPFRALLAKSIKSLIVALGGLVALEQLGFDTSQLAAMVSLGYGVVAASVALGFALGARHAFKHLIARHYAKALLRVGDIVEVGQARGRLLRFEWLYAVLQDDEDGAQYFIPCGELMGDTFRFEQSAQGDDDDSGERAHVQAGDAA